LVAEPAGADFVVVNTCGFIEQAREESYTAIHEMVELKQRGQLRGIIVSGCLAERQKEQLLIDCPDIDQLVGVFGREEITKVADRLVGNLAEQRSVFRPAPIRALADTQRLRITPAHFAYLKISEGCDRLCTFCAIPKMRGKHATKPIEEVIHEARELAATGVRELIVVAQDTPYYGMDLYGEPRLAELLAELETVKGIEWIRLMYFYPMFVTERVVDQIAASKKILPYLDMPLQHINDTMLKRMSRRVTRCETETLLDRLRERIPNLVLRTTFITGFPGETDEQFAELVDFVERQRFERMGGFTYSFEPDTPAATLPDHVPENVKEERRDHLMQVQQQNSFRWNEEKIGSELDMIVDRPAPDAPATGGVWVARTFADAPDVDAVVWLTAADTQPGEIVSAEVVATHGYDLVAASV
jgi:ribosomal protein S12 methylthiotransferase